MKIMHLSDLHLGKRVNEFSMMDDQQYILTQILTIIDKQQIEVVCIAGDVYDKAIPSGDAVELFDDFLVKLANRNISVFVISGNHDSPQRIAFGAELMNKSGIYMSPVYQGYVDAVVLKDEYGPLNVYMLPFIKPVHVRRYFEEEGIESYSDAMQVAIQQMNMNKEERNILITHQFVTGASRCDSEELSLGGSDHVDVNVFDGIDYVALGHIHRPQRCGSEYIRYCGTPLKYSFSEASDKKSVTIVDMKEKGNIELSYIPLVPKRDLVELRGTYEQLVSKEFYMGTSYQEDYVHITLTDEEDIPDVLAKLRVIYKNIMKLDYDNTRTRHYCEIHGASAMEQKSPFQHFSEFYELQNGVELNTEQEQFMKRLMLEVWEDEL